MGFRELLLGILGVSWRRTLSEEYVYNPPNNASILGAIAKIY